MTRKLESKTIRVLTVNVSTGSKSISPVSVNAKSKKLGIERLVNSQPSKLRLRLKHRSVKLERMPKRKETNSVHNKSQSIRQLVLRDLRQSIRQPVLKDLRPLFSH